MYSNTVSIITSENMYNVPELVQKACRYKSHITIKNNHCAFNAKSIMGMMSLDPRDGILTITAEGTDEVDAVNDLIAFIKSSL